jgi:asparagine synthetase A
MSYEVDFDTFAELVNKIFKKYKLGKADTLDQYQDSNLAPEFINFSNSKSLKQTNLKNAEAVIPEED